MPPTIGKSLMAPALPSAQTGCNPRCQTASAVSRPSATCRPVTTSSSGASLTALLLIGPNAILPSFAPSRSSPTRRIATGSSSRSLTSGRKAATSAGTLRPLPNGQCGWKRSAVAGCGQSYQGRSSPFWYDAAQFHELLLACGTQRVRALVPQLDGCTGGKAGELIAAARLDRMRCAELSRKQASRLLQAARGAARPVSPDRIGVVGRDAFDDHHYAKEQGTVTLGGSQPQAEVPFVVEAWAWKLPSRVKSRAEIAIDLLINRTPSVVETSAWRDAENRLCLRGNGLLHCYTGAPKKGSFGLVVNITTPYCPITSDGKAPNLEPFADAILDAVAAAMRKAQRAAPKDRKISQKDVVLENLDDAIAAASGDGEYRFNERQIFYQLRPIVLEETGQELLIGNFKRIITDYEAENGEIPGMYREPRGSIYHPHRNENIALGTLAVEEYKRPRWTFNKLVYVEKEGFSEALKADGWPERHDCAPDVIERLHDARRPRPGRQACRARRAGDHLLRS